MNMKNLCPAALLVLLASPAPAHHNSAVTYDPSASITLQGTVKEFHLVSPHARIDVTVVDANGESHDWLLEGANGAVLRRRLGWTVDQLKVGEKITVTGAPSRDGSRRVEWRVITRADGTTLGGGNGFPQEREEDAQRLEQQRRSQGSSGKK
jgi:hypothetical protein